MFIMPSAKQDSIQITVDVDNYPLSMEMNTGASSLSIVNKNHLSSAPKVEPTSQRTYAGDSIKVLGYLSVNMCHNGQEKRLPLLVVSEEGLSLLGRNWLHQLKLDWTSVFHLQSVREGSCIP